MITSKPVRFASLVWLWLTRCNGCAKPCTCRTGFDATAVVLGVRVRPLNRKEKSKDEHAATTVLPEGALIRQMTHTYTRTETQHAQRHNTHAQM